MKSADCLIKYLRHPDLGPVLAKLLQNLCPLIERDRDSGVVTGVNCNVCSAMISIEVSSFHMCKLKGRQQAAGTEFMLVNGKKKNCMLCGSYWPKAPEPHYCSQVLQGRVRAGSGQGQGRAGSLDA